MSLCRYTREKSEAIEISMGQQKFNAQNEQNTPYGSVYTSERLIPHDRVPDEGMSANMAGQLLQDELDLDGRPNLNLASFVGTFMEDQAKSLLMENLSKNLSDNDEYPALMSFHSRCVSMIANMWHVQPGETAVGTATTGSSEAIHLGGLAMKRRWQERRRAEGKDISHPNIVMGANAQVALLKFARYFDVEARIIPVDKSSGFGLDPKKLESYLDDNTIGVFAILGSTFTGHYDPIEDIARILDTFQEVHGIDIPIHVDAASGGFVAPFTFAGAEEYTWDFKIRRVKSINASGHKFGLVYVGLGWVVWRDETCLPKDLIFELDYLGSTQETYTLSFSRPGGPVIAQYYNFVRLGRIGFRTIMENCLENARFLSNKLELTGWYTCVSQIHQRHQRTGMQNAKFVSYGSGQCSSAQFKAGLPVVAFSFSDQFSQQFPGISLYSVSELLRARQYIVPCYRLPAEGEEQAVLRVVVRESMTLSLLTGLFKEICTITHVLLDSATKIGDRGCCGNPATEKEVDFHEWQNIDHHDFERLCD